MSWNVHVVCVSAECWETQTGSFLITCKLWIQTENTRYGTATVECYIDQVSCFRLTRTMIYLVQYLRFLPSIRQIICWVQNNFSVPCVELVFSRSLSLSFVRLVVLMLLASLISHIILHSVMKLLTPTRANILCSDLHLRCWHWSMLHRLLSALVSPVLLWQTDSLTYDLISNVFLCQNASNRKLRKTVLFLYSILTVPPYWVFWLTARIPESLCWHVIALGQKQANRS